MCLEVSRFQLIRIVGIILYVHVCAVGPHRAVNTMWRKRSRKNLAVFQSSIQSFFRLVLFSVPPFLPSCLSIQQHPFTPSKSVSLSGPSAPSACRRDEVMHHRRSAEPSPLAVSSLCPPLSHKHMVASLCQRPSQNT